METKLLPVKVRCYHYDECGKDAVYDFETVFGEKINVCAECDEDYSICEICGKCEIHWEMRRFLPEDERPTCSVCFKKREKELEAELKADVYRFVEKTMPTYHTSVREWFIVDIVDGVKETSGYEDNHCYNESDISLAFQKAIINMIEMLESAEYADSPTDTYGRCAKTFLEEYFKSEYCAECGGDAKHHTAVMLNDNWFARCDFQPLEDGNWHPVIAQFRKESA